MSRREDVDLVANKAKLWYFNIVPMLKQYLTSRGLFLILIPAILSIVAYWNTLGNGFVWDDNDAIVENIAIRSLDLQTLENFFIRKEVYHAAGEIYRPLNILTYAIDYKIYGLVPFGYHLTNLVIHTLNSILVYITFTTLLRDKYIALVSSILFAVHPIHTEAVDWIKDRDDLLALMFFLLALYFYVKSVHGSCLPLPRRQAGNRQARLTVHYFLALISYTLALLSKEMAITLPFILILHNICFYPEEVKRLKNWAVYMPFFLINGIYFVVRTIILGQMAQTHYLGGSFISAMYTMAKGIVYYIKLLILPINLCANYLTFPISRSVDWQVVLSLFVLFGVITTAVVSYRYSKRSTFSILWFFVTILPVSNIVPIKISIAERFLYMPSIGFCLIFAITIVWIWKVYPQFRKVTSILFIAIIVLYTMLTIDRNKVWKDEFVFNSDIIKKYPNNSRARYNIAGEYYKGGRLDEAIDEYKMAIEFDPIYADAYYKLGLVYYEKGFINESITAYQNALRLYQNLVRFKGFESVIKYIRGAHNNLGNVYARKGLYEEAIKHYEEALRIDPNDAVILHNLEIVRKKFGLERH